MDRGEPREIERERSRRAYIPCDCNQRNHFPVCNVCAAFTHKRRVSPHCSFLLDVLDKDPSEDESEQAANAVDLCMSLCERFPMKGASITCDQKDNLRVSIPIDGPANRGKGPVMLHLKRRVADGAADGDWKPAREISNILWAGSLVLARYSQACPHILVVGSSLCYPPPSPWKT